RAHLDAVERLATRATAAGDHAGAARWWRRRAAGEPLSGRVALALMQALADSGDVTGAVQHARVHAAMVRAELETDADDRVLAFAERLRAGDWTPTPTPTPTPGASAPPSRTPAPEPDASTPGAATPNSHRETSVPRLRAARALSFAAGFGAIIALSL